MRSHTHTSVLVFLAAVGPTVCAACLAAQDNTHVASSLADFIENRIPSNQLSIEYTDLHPLWGGLRLIVTGDGAVSQEAVRVQAGEPSSLSRDDVVRLVRHIVETKAWVQETPDREARPDEARAYLNISIGEKRSVTWEWYNELQTASRLVQVRELMKDLVWRRAQAQPVLELLRAEFRKRNPAIHHVTIFEVRSPFIEATRRAVLARGIREDLQFVGNFGDELFGVFVLNDSLTRILAVLDVFPTPRWRDFAVEFARVTPDSLYLEGRGATYEDQPLKRSYTWP